MSEFTPAAPRFEIRADDLSGLAIQALLREHLTDSAAHSPPESVHALDLTGLSAPQVSVWSAWHGSELAGCGALQELDGAHGEIKSMRTAASFLRQGVATAILSHILRVARVRGYQRLSLETGSMDAYAPARSLYRRFGFEACAPFASYSEDPHSVFMTLSLASTEDGPFFGKR